MDIKISEGDFAHMGVYQEKESIVFTFEAEKNDTCSIINELKRLSSSG